MKNKDDLILEQLYQEGILDRLGGQFKGIKAGSGQLLQNLGRKIYQKAGGEGMPAPSQTTGQAYAKAQQKSLLNSFIKKTNNEIEDFRKDLLAMGVSGDPEEIKKTHPVIAQRLKQVESLLNYLNNPSAAPSPQPAATPAEAPAATPAATPAKAIPNEARITDKSGNVFEYDADDKKWYIASKGGKSLTPIPDDNDNIQKIITNAWNKKQTTEPSATEAPKPKASIPPPPPFLIDNKTTAEEIKSEISIRKSALNSYDYGKDGNEKIQNEISSLEKELLNRETSVAPAAQTATPSIWLNTQQAADYLNINNKELWNLSKSGKIKAIKRPNGNYKFSRQALEKYKNKQSVSTESYNVFDDFFKKYNII